MIPGSSDGEKSGEYVVPVSSGFGNHFQVQVGRHLHLGRRLFLSQGHVLQLTRRSVAVGSLHVVFHVALLREADAAHLTLKRLLSRVFDHVDLQGTLLVEGLVALDALKGTLACVCSVVSLQLAALREGLRTRCTVEDSGFLGAG